MTQLQRAQFVRRVLDAYPHLASLAPGQLFADAGEPELDDRAGYSGVDAETRKA